MKSLINKQIKPMIHRFGMWLASVTKPVDSPEMNSADNLTSISSSDCTFADSAHLTVPPIVMDREPVFPELNDSDNPSDSKLDAEGEFETGAVCKVLNVLERQLKEVTVDVESAVVGVCQGFQGMAARAQSAVNAAESALGTGVENESGKDAIREIRKVLETLVGNAQSSHDYSQKVTGKLNNLEARLAEVQKTLKEVEAIANKAKLVALNGQIEASRLGEAGRAVGVVATETKTLASHAAATSDSIRNSVGILAAELKATSTDLKRQTEEDSLRFLESEQLTRSLLDGLEKSHQQIMGSLGNTSRISGELKSDITRAVMSLQFQDRVSQRIAHVIETLEMVVDRIDPDYSEDSDSSVTSEWLSEISSRYTMDSERTALSGNAFSHSSSNAKSEQEFSVELF